MPAGAMREGRQSAHVSMAGQEQGSRRDTARREERGTEGGARVNNTGGSERAAGPQGPNKRHLW